MATEFVGIELQLMGADGVRADLMNLDRLLKSLGGRKKFNAGFNEARAQVVAYRGELMKLQQLQSRLQQRVAKYGDSGLSASALKKTEAAIEATKNGLKNAQQAVREFGLASRQAGQTFQQAFNSISSKAAHVGSSMQSMGNALTRLTSPLNRLTTGILYSAGYKALNMFTQGISGAFERYDTMQTYEKSLTALGLDATKKFAIGTREAMTAIDNLNESVLGLPTGLDEIVAAQKVYAGATGEMEKSTKTAIAANNTFLASGMDSRGQRFMQKYLTALSSGAELTTNQWQSMARIAPLAMRAVSEELGYASKDYQQFTKDLYAGEVAGERFLEAFIKVGTEGKVQAAANVMKTTWSGLAANIQNAFKRMGEGILKAFDDAFVSTNGRNLIQNLLGFDAEGNDIGGGIKHWINDISSSIQDWIRANPQKIIDFFNDLKSIDIKGLFKGIAEGMATYAKLLRSVIGIFDGKGLSGVGKGLIYLNMLGKSMTIFGGIIKGLRHPIALIGALVPRIGKLGIFGRLAELFGIGKGASKIKEVADGAGALGKASGGMLTMAKNIGLFAASVAAIGGAGFVAFRSFKTIVKDLHEAIAEINSFSTGEIQSAEAILFVMAAGMTGLVTAFDAIGLAVGSLGSIATMPAVVGGVATAIVGALGALVATEVMTVFKNFELSTKALKKGLENISELGNIKYNKKGVEDALGTMKDIMSIFDSSYVEQGGAKEGVKTHSDWSANAAKMKVVTQDISDAVTSIKNTMNELKALPELSDEEISSATEKVESVITGMRDIADTLNLKFDTGILDFLGGGAVITEGTTERGANIVSTISGMIQTIKNTVADLKELEKLEADIDEAVQNAKTVGEKMGEIFSALNTAFGEETTVHVGGSEATETYNSGVTREQTRKATALQSLLESYKATIASIRNIYDSIMGGEGDMSFNSEDFGKVMDNITGENGILPQLKSMYDELISEESGFGKETDVDLAGIMSGFATAIGSLKQAVTTLSEIGQIEFEGDTGMSGVVTQINEMISNLSTAFNEETIGALNAQIESFKTSIASLKASLESIGSIGGEGEGGITVAINIIPEITGDDETVKALQDAHDAIEEKIEDIKALSGAININIPISVSLPGLEGAIQSMYSAASRLRAARSALNSARGGGGGWSTGGMVSPYGAIYRARGGNIGFPGRPRGTDTIPVWASPGEYIHNKHAVDFFGIDFMRKINHLDVRGAIESLMTKAGNMANVGRQTIINNTYNNTYNNTNNINTNSPDFVTKVSSRFAGAF